MEKFNNIAQSTLNGSINNSTTSVVVTSASSFPTTGNFRIVIDSEIMLVTSVSSNTFTVTRASESTAAASHSDLANVTHVLTSGALAAAFPRQLFDHYVDVSNVNTAETTLYSDSFVAGQFGTIGDKAISQYGGTFAGAASSTQQLRVYFGTSGGETLIFNSGALAVGNAQSWNIWTFLIMESSTIVRAIVSLNTSSVALNASATYTKVTGLTLSNAQVLKLTGTAAGALGASNMITASMGYIQYCPVA